MYYVYVLTSTADGTMYIGCTNDLRRRLLEHNTQRAPGSASRGPYELAYYEAYRDKQEAFAREASLKLRGQARVQLRKRILKSLQGET